jgi:hypothetical protein
MMYPSDYSPNIVLSGVRILDLHGMSDAVQC